MRKNLRVFYLSLILVQLLCLYGCDSDNNPTDPGENMQNPYLSVKILTPNSNSSFCTNLQDISLEGNIVSSLRVLSLKWTSTSRSSGSVEPESNWSIESIPLVPGDQTIMVEVTDVAHTTASDQIQVTFNQNLEITADLSLSPSVILTDESSVISASITAEVIDPASIEQVYLVKVNPDNVVTDTLTAMFDDGQVEHGDRYTNDNIYSGLVIVDEPVAAIISLRALFDVNASNEMIQEFSSRRKLTILDQVAESEFDQLINILNETEQLIEQNAENLTDTELIDLISSWLQTEEVIVDVEIDYSGSIFFDLGGGLHSEIHFAEIETDNVLLSTLSSQDLAESETFSDELDVYSDEYILNNRGVLIWDPFHHDFPINYVPSLEILFEHETAPARFQVDTKIDEQCTVESLLDLTDYGTIIIGDHGGKNPNIITGEKCNNYEQYLEKYKLVNGNIYVALIAVNKIPLGEYFVVEPEFLNSIPGTFDNSIVFMGSCYSTYDPSLRNAFLNKGASTFLGFNGKVGSLFTYNMAEQFFSDMVFNLQSVPEAYRANQRDPNNAGTKFEKYSVNAQSPWHFVASLDGGWNAYETVIITGYERSPDGQRYTINETLTDDAYTSIYQSGSELHWETTMEGIYRSANLDKKRIIGQDGVCVVFNPDVEVQVTENIYHFDGEVANRNAFSVSGYGDASGEIRSGEFAGYTFNYHLVSEGEFQRSNIPVSQPTGTPEYYSRLLKQLLSK